MINIAMSTTDDWQYMYVAIYSILVNLSRPRECAFHILTNEDFCADGEEKISKLCESFGAFAKIYRVGTMFKDAETHIEWINSSTYYRLVLPEILTNDGKCLYLDSDIVVLEDILQLYNTNIDDVLVAGVYAIAYHKFPSPDEYCRQANLESLDKYINAGVLLMNLDMMREHHFSEKAMAMIDKGYPSQDQDIINNLCFSHIGILPFKYNVMTKYFDWDEKDFSPMYGKEEIIHAFNHPVIIHYADRKKPWKDLSTPMGDYWWFYCKKTNLWNYWYNKKADEFIYKGLFGNDCKTGVYKRKKLINKLLYEDKVIVYGAGKIAHAVIEDLLKIDVTVECVLVTKNTDNPTEINGVKVISISDANDEEKSTPIIIAVNNHYSPDVINTLWSSGFFNIVLLDNEGLW